VHVARFRWLDNRRPAQVPFNGFRERAVSLPGRAPGTLCGWAVLMKCVQGFGCVGELCAVWFVSRARARGLGSVRSPVVGRRRGFGSEFSRCAWGPLVGGW